MHVHACECAYVSACVIIRVQIAGSFPVKTAILPLQEAMALPSLCAVFGEVYPDPVRVVTIGHDTPETHQAAQTQGADKVHSSVELCGGTHLSNAAQLEVRVFKASFIKRASFFHLLLCCAGVYADCKSVFGCFCSFSLTI